MVLSNNDNVDWKLMYFTLQKHYPKKEEFGDTLHFCKHCSSLFWKVTKLTRHHASPDYNKNRYELVLRRLFDNMQDDFCFKTLSHLVKRPLFSAHI